MKRKLFLLTLFLVWTLLVLGVVNQATTQAQEPPPPPSPPPPSVVPGQPPQSLTFGAGVLGYDTSISDTGGAVTLVNTLIKWAQYLFFFLAAIFGIWSAYDFLTSAGEEAKVKNARNRLVFALVAVAIALMAGGLPRIVQEIVK